MFRFKRFLIEQDRTPMKVGTDGVLLGAWVSVAEGCRRVLDIGTGTGLIALMVAQRTEKIEGVNLLIDGVEIEQESAAQARENVERSEWGSRVSIHHSDIQTFHSTEKYDLIVTNPPYFVDSLRSPNSLRTTARHTTDLSFRDLVLSAVRLLSPERGRFALILPAAESKLFDAEALGRLVLVRRCEVFSREGAPVKRVMSEYILSNPQAQTPNRLLSHIMLESGQPPQPTEEYKSLTRDFYLKF